MAEAVPAEDLQHGIGMSAVQTWMVTIKLNTENSFLKSHWDKISSLKGTPAAPMNKVFPTPYWVQFPISLIELWMRKKAFCSCLIVRVHKHFCFIKGYWEKQCSIVTSCSLWCHPMSTKENIQASLVEQITVEAIGRSWAGLVLVVRKMNGKLRIPLWFLCLPLKIGGNVWILHAS